MSELPSGMVEQEEPLPLLDEETISSIRKSVGPESLAALVAAIEDDCGSALADLERAERTGERHLLQRSAHRLKGIFAQFGARRAAHLARYISDEMRSGEDASAAELISVGRASTEAVKRALQD